MNSPNDLNSQPDSIRDLLSALLPKTVRRHPTTSIVLTIVVLVGGGAFTLFCSLEDVNKQKVLNFILELSSTIFTSTFSVNSLLFGVLVSLSIAGFYMLWKSKHAQLPHTPAPARESAEQITEKVELERQLSEITDERDLLRQQLATLKSRTAPIPKPKKKLDRLPAEELQIFRCILKNANITRSELIRRLGIDAYNHERLLKPLNTLCWTFGYVREDAFGPDEFIYILEPRGREYAFQEGID
jgi:hypothetical protein